MNYIKAYFGFLLIFLVVDALWITLIANNLYQQDLGNVLLPTPNMLPVLAFYIAYAIGVVYLAIKPALNSGNARDALINGAIIGSLAYGTYAVTNYAMIDGWSARIAVSDILWGPFITALSSWAGYLAAKPSNT